MSWRIKILYVIDAINEIMAFCKYKKCDVLLSCQDVDRGDLKFGRPYSKLLDSVHENLTTKGYDCIQIAPPFSTLTGKKAWAEPYSTTGLYLSIHLNIKFKKLFYKLFQKRTISKVYPSNCFYSKILAKVEPKFIVVIGAPSALCQEARKRNIPILELLHGIGYDSVKWGWEKQKAENLPTHILSLDSISTKSFSQLAAKGIKTIEIPHPWYSRFNEEEDKLNLDPKWLERPQCIPINKKVILLSLSWGYDGDHSPYDYYANILPNGLIPEEVLEVIRLTQNDVFWCIRRHPVQVRSKNYDYQIKFLNKLTQKFSNCEWQDCTINTLNAVLQVCDGHIAMSSMTAYEAAYMGIKTLMLCPTLKSGAENCNFFSDLEKANYVTKADSNIEFIYDWVNNVRRTSRLPLNYATKSSWDLLLKELDNFYTDTNV